MHYFEDRPREDDSTYTHSNALFQHKKDIAICLKGAHYDADTDPNVTASPIVRPKTETSSMLQSLLDAIICSVCSMCS